MPRNGLTTLDGLRHSIGGTLVHPSKRAIETKRVIDYLHNLGFAIATADDVLRAIEADPFEEELSAFRCVEGIAVAHASDGWWLLFPNGALGSVPCAMVDQSSPICGDQSCWSRVREAGRALSIVSTFFSHAKRLSAQRVRSASPVVEVTLFRLVVLLPGARLDQRSKS